jgi:hypothetical protein
LVGPCDVRPPGSAVPEPGLVLATVVVRFHDRGGADVEGASTTAVRDALMEHPDVVTVRPDGGDTTWLYRMDVEVERIEDASDTAAMPGQSVAERFGWQADFEGVVFMGSSEKAAFHRRFIQARSHWDVRERGDELRGGQT